MTQSEHHDVPLRHNGASSRYGMVLCVEVDFGVAIDDALEHAIEDWVTEALRDAHSETDVDSDLTRESARTSWSMVLAMDALDLRAAGDMQAAEARIDEIRALKPTTPREVLVLGYLQGKQHAASLPDDHDEQAAPVNYDPSLIFISNTGI